MKESILSNPKKEPIILLHGLFGSLSNWSNVVDYFSNDFEIFTPVLPLYELSFKEKLKSLTQFLHQYIKENKIHNPILIGNSLGGHVALLYSLKYPENVKKLILVGSSGLYENDLGSSFVRVRDYKFIQSKVEEVFDVKEVISNELIQEVYQTANTPSKAVSLIKIAREAKKQNLREELKNIKTPSLLIWGMQDRVTPPSVAKEFEQFLPDARLRMIDNCGHVPMMEQPVLFNQYVNEFIKAS